MFDFSKLDLSASAEQGATLQVRHPVSGIELEGVTIKVVGTDSKRFRDILKNKAREQMNRKNKPIDLQKAEKESIEMLAACTLGWTGISEGGTELQFSTENAIMMYKKYLWLREQVDEFMNDRANFGMIA